VTTAAALISMIAFAVVAVPGSGRDGGVAAVNACITQTRFLVLVRHGSGNNVIEMIKDRAHGAVVGELAVLPSDREAEAFPVTLAGSGARNGRYVMATATPLGRDAAAIEGCTDRLFRIAPDA
jgi:hypothetical protein